jgi:hypothetical protein
VIFGSFWRSHHWHSIQSIQNLQKKQGMPKDIKATKILNQRTFRKTERNKRKIQKAEKC